jgi:hypothetical protein
LYKDCALLIDSNPSKRSIKQLAKGKAQETNSWQWEQSSIVLDDLLFQPSLNWQYGFC